MPGHKGISLLGFEKYDITEITGADELYVADGIIGESEKNAADLFKSHMTLYSTEGSSQCIRAMLQLVMCGSDVKHTIYKTKQSADNVTSLHKSAGTMTAAAKPYSPYILAARNAHKAFIYGLALTGLEAEWLYPENASNSLCSCPISAAQVDSFLSEAATLPLAVYITSPDYLGNIADIKGISEVCHRYGLPLMVDNAHGAYLKFLSPGRHPLDLGADICCDSAHKTLPVITGGAYLHIASSLNITKADAKAAMALYGSTSPSYLIMASLDNCNKYLAEGYHERLEKTISMVNETKKKLTDNNWIVEATDEPMKITIRLPRLAETIDKTSNTTNTHGSDRQAYSDIEMPKQPAQILRMNSIEYEYADEDYIVLMPSTETTEADFARLVDALGINTMVCSEPYKLYLTKSENMISIRDAIFSPAESIPVSEALGRICATPTVSCPPAIPIAVSGEIITEDMLKIFKHYGIEEIRVIKKEN